ncbi:MAG: DUF1345 domain-containing protein [Deltaproteobacteria bacterium]|nr:DUF1345 domain-containing protein [Deltaproteobacteria bacterium]
MSMPVHAGADRRALPSFADPRRAVGRLVLSVAVGVVAAMLIPQTLGWAVRAVAGWCAGGTFLLVAAWVVIVRSDVAVTRMRCSQEDPGRFLVWVVVVVGSLFSLFSAVGLLQHSKEMSQHASLLTLLCLWAVACAWCLTHSAFTLRYAHLYYRDDGNGEGGLDFPGRQAPDDLDFAYFSFTIGTCFQTSDVSISERIIRRTVLLHGVISFAFNTAILALVLNLVFGHL